MVQQAIATMLKLLRNRGITDSDVLAAMAGVPRHEFVPEYVRANAYGDFALPLAHGQTVSQPYMVALMSEALQLQKGERVLEIGTGSGYQAAILAYMGMEVYTIERIAALYQAAQLRLQSLGYSVHCLLADGHDGWPEHAPYQGIIVTCAPTNVPQTLVDQLAEAGRLVIPVGPVGGYQTLWCYTKQAGEIDKSSLGGVAFVPFLRHIDSSQT